jgi:ubiquinone/menaquinone biosynthesis C-methylase UbiE
MADPIVQEVQAKYAAAATSQLSGDHPGVRAVAEAFGYSPEELAAIPAEANLGLSCGNPTAFAGLRPGETVVDLGCGAGLDVLLAAARVGPAGKAIGIDMTPEMIARARQNAARPVNGQKLSNVDFHLAQIDQLPLADGSVDCVISNCVLNLVPDKAAAFHEIWRVLKQGGRLAVTDIALKKPLPDELARDVLAYVGCIAGAILIADYERGLREAGFQTIQVIDTRKDLRAYEQVENQSACCSPAAAPDGLPMTTCGDSGAVHQGLAVLLRRYDINEYAASVQVYALKDASATRQRRSTAPPETGSTAPGAAQ